MALNNIFLQDMIENINSFKMLDARCSTDVKEKEFLAVFFRETFLDAVIRGKHSLFFESGSCPAYVAKELGNSKRFIEAVSKSKIETSLNLYTNNILVFLEFWLNDHLPVFMLPRTIPREPYGASYGILDELIDDNRLPDFRRNSLDKYAKDAITSMINSPDTVPIEENTLLICSISGMQISDKHTIFLDSQIGDELKRQIDQCYGFHAGSYRHIVFKRYLYTTGLPVIMMITRSKIDLGITPNRCHFIFDKEYRWEEFCKKHPLAFCVGCKIEEYERIIKIFNEMSFDTNYKIYNEYAVVLATNSVFLEKFAF